MEADIEVLKTQVGGLRDAIDGISSKIDSVLALQESLVRLQEQHSNTREALDRAFKLIVEVREESEHTAAKVSSWGVGGAVAFLLGGVITAMVQWYAMKRDNEIDRMGDSLITVERRLAWIEHERYGRAGQEPPDNKDGESR